MDTFREPSTSSAHKLKDVTDNHEKCKSKDIEKNKSAFKSRIPIKTNNKLENSLPDKVDTEILQIKNPKSKLEIVLMEPFEKKPILAKTAELIANEIKIREGFTAQDIFRLRVPNPWTYLQEACNECDFYSINEPRYRMPLLVLDLETLQLTYPAIVPSNKPTILDLFEVVYEYFDIAIWSSNKMADLIPKLENFEIFKPKNKFEIAFVLDKTSMIPSFTTKSIMAKQIQVIWTLYPQYNEHNSIMVNHNLKEVIYALYKIPTKKHKQNEQVDEIALKVIMDYLTKTLRSRKSLLALNTLVWNRYN